MRVACQHRGLPSKVGPRGAPTLALLARHVWHAWVTALRRFVSPFALNQLGGERPLAEEAEDDAGPAPLRGAGCRARNWADAPMGGLLGWALGFRGFGMAVESRLLGREVAGGGWRDKIADAAVDAGEMAPSHGRSTWCLDLQRSRALNRACLASRIEWQAAAQQHQLGEAHQLSNTANLPS